MKNKYKFIKLSIFAVFISFLNSINVFAAGQCVDMLGPRTDKFLLTLLTILFWAFPVVTIIYSLGDIMKAVTGDSGKENKIVIKKFALRLAIIVIVMMTPSLLKLVFNAVGIQFCFMT